MKRKLLLSLIAAFFFVHSYSQITINEYSCANLATTLDNYNEYNDWIELANAGPVPISISGYYVSDDIENPLKWKIPAGVVISNGGYRTIWADGRNEFLNNHLHASFKLTQSKKNPDWIVISNASGILIDKVQIQRHQKGHSMGKLNSSWLIFTTPTPGNGNSGIYKIRYAAAPVFTKSPGFYTNSFRVYLINPEPNSRMYYTINGNDPASSGQQYTSAGILIDSTKIIKVVTYSFSTSILPSFFTFGTFFLNVNHTLPVISIAGTDLNTLANGNQSFRPDGSFEFFDQNKVLKETAYGNFNSHGQDSWANDQRSLDYKTRDEMGYNDAIHEKLFSLSERSEFQGIILRAAGDDNYPAAHHSANAGSAHIRDAYVQNMAIQGKLDVDARTGAKAIVYLNGKYWGIYDMRERADEQDYTKYYYNQDKYNLQYILTWGGTWAEYGGNQALADWNTIRTFAMTNNMANAANYQYVIDRIDVKSLVDYAIVNSVSVCSDWLNYNTGWWRGLDPKGGHKKWGYTLWDNDAVFGFYINYTGVPSTAYTAPPCNIESSSLDDPEGHIELILKLRQNPTFNQFYISRYIDLFNTTFSCSNMLYNLDSIKNLLNPEMTAHANRWFGTYTEWNTNATSLRNYVSNRCGVLSSGLNTCYNLSGPYNTTFKTIPANSGSIQVNSLTFNTLPYTGRYHGKIDVLLKAIPNKDFIFDYWTVGIDTFKTSLALANAIVRIAGIDTIVAHFANRVNYPKLNFTEINYKNDPTINAGTWFELTNYGNTSINISGWKIMQGKWREHIFPQGSIIGAGEHWILASDSIQFNSIYKNNTIIKKYVLFDLSKENESLRLIDTSGTEFLNVNYDNKQPWPIAADGAGRTLELKNDTLNSSLVSSWRNGCVGGSPGLSFQNCNEKFIVSEINYNSGQVIDAGTWFEILNTTAQNINLSGYVIRNKSFENKYIISSGTILNANGRLVFCNDSLKFSKYFPTKNVKQLTNFSLDNDGDKIGFYTAADTLIFSLVFKDTLAFTNQADGTGYTLDYNNTNNDYSQGVNWSISCIGGSPNNTKGSCVSGIIFSEINYKSAPFNDGGDWIEIKNISSNTYNLKGWQISDSTSGGFYIPNNYFLAPNSYVVLTSDSTKFKKMYPHVQNFIGNLNFNLSSNGERINIYDTSFNFISTINYSDSLPWPAYIDNRGYTMELRYDTSDFHLGNKWFRGCLGGSPGIAYQSCNDSVVIGEINYNSHPKADAGDWVELWNKSATNVDISGWLFQDNDLKDTFLIPQNTLLNAGSRLVLVNDSLKFKSVFPNVKNYKGNFSFGLSSVADQIVLRNNNSKLKFGMAYTIDSTWVALANGQGYTMELDKDSFDRSIGAYWKSKCPSGSPGTIATNCSEDIIISEINYKSDPIYNKGDWFEIYNRGIIPVNFANHYIANKDSLLNSIVSGSVSSGLIFAGEFLILSNDTNAFNKFHPNFKNKLQLKYALKDTGDEIKIYDSNKNLILNTRYSASTPWPEMSNGKGFSLERKNYISNLNDETNWEMGCFGGSPGMVKQNCKINLVVSEINYNPKTTEDDGQWVELKNVSLTDTIILQSSSIYVQSLNARTTLNKSIKLLPNSYLVVSSDSIKFSKFHNTNSGNYYFDPLFKISTSSDELSLYDAGDQKLYLARYNASEPKFQATNGKGYTLEYIDTNKNFYDEKNWFVGCRHGSAGMPYQICDTILRFTEINYKSHPKFEMGKWIEIKNIGSYPIDASNWILQNSSSSQNLKSNLILNPNEVVIVGNKINELSKNYNLVNVQKDSLILNLGVVDTLRILSNDSIIIAQTNYSNSGTWPMADGTAYTLEYNFTASNKFMIGCPGGSPGTDQMNCFANAWITEINYNSHQKNLCNDWIELENKGKIPFCMDGWNFKSNDSNAILTSNKLNLVFGNEKYIIAKSVLDFLKLHTVLNLIENSKLNLPDNGTTLKIVDANNILIDSVKFSNSSPWSSEANNTGRTLEYIGTVDNSNPFQWVAGCLGGSPGINYSSPCNYKLLVSEINYHSLPAYNTGDWAEIHNTTGNAIDISNYSLKTKNTTSNIPNSTIVPANGYLVIAQNKIQFSSIFPAVNNVIEIATLQIEDGDQIELFNNQGNIIYYVNFDTIAPWPLQTNKGYTLEYGDTSKDIWNALNWFRGCFAGTPGRGYALPCGINGINDDLLASDFRIFPNPNNGQFNIYAPTVGEIKIYDMKGSLVFFRTISQGNNDIVVNLSKGMYFVSYSNKNGVVTSKIIIE